MINEDYQLCVMLLCYEFQKRPVGDQKISGFYSGFCFALGHTTGASCNYPNVHVVCGATSPQLLLQQEEFRGALYRKSLILICRNCSRQNRHFSIAS